MDVTHTKRQVLTVGHAPGVAWWFPSGRWRARGPAGYFQPIGL
jgi:hypothetical protein